MVLTEYILKRIVFLQICCIINGLFHAINTPLPPNVLVETIDEDINKQVENAELASPVNFSNPSTPLEIKSDSQDFTDTSDHRHRQDL